MYGKLQTKLRKISYKFYYGRPTEKEYRKLQRCWLAARNELQRIWRVYVYYDNQGKMQIERRQFNRRERVLNKIQEKILTMLK